MLASARRCHSEKRRPLLTSESGVAGDAIDERSEDGTDTDTSTGETDDGSTSTVDLGGGDDGRGGRLDDDASGLHHTTHDVGGEVIADTIAEQAVVDGRLARGADDGAWDASWNLE